MMLILILTVPQNVLHLPVDWADVCAKCWLLRTFHLREELLAVIWHDWRLDILVVLLAHIACC